jgi:hypothetical protein
MRADSLPRRLLRWRAYRQGMKLAKLSAVNPSAQSFGNGTVPLPMLGSVCQAHWRAGIAAGSWRRPERTLPVALARRPQPSLLAQATLLFRLGLALRPLASAARDQGWWCRGPLPGWPRPSAQGRCAHHLLPDIKYPFNRRPAHLATPSRHRDAACGRLGARC